MQFRGWRKENVHTWLDGKANAQSGQEHTIVRYVDDSIFCAKTNIGCCLNQDFQI